MKIAFITTMHIAPWGGSEELWAAAASLAIADGHEVFCSIYEWQEVPHKIMILEKEGAIIFKKSKKLDSSILKRIIGKVEREVLKTSPEIKAVQAFKPDLICYSQGDSFSAAENVSYQQLHQVVNIPYFLISQMNYEFKKYDGWNSEGLLRFIQRANRFLFVSKRNLDTARLQLLKPLENAYCLNNPVYLSSHSIVPYKKTETVQLAMVARFDTQFKGQDLVLHILSKTKWLTRNWKLNLYGKGPDLDYLVQVIKFCELEDRVSIHGHSSDIREVWAENHIQLMPSFAEGTPLALMEAMVCGRTAVVSDVGGNAEIIEDGITGFIAAAATLTLYEAALEKAWGQKENWQQMGESAHDSILKKINLSPEKELLGLMLA